MAIPLYTRIGIRSKEFGTYLSLDGTDDKRPRDGGWPDTITNVEYLKALEIFYLHYNTDGTVSFEGSTFPEAFLRLDGTGVPAGFNKPGGGGTVNSQYEIADWERFYIRRQDDTTAFVAIESAAFPGRYLRVDSAKNANVQGVVLNWEKFEIVVLPPI